MSTSVNSRRRRRAIRNGTWAHNVDIDTIRAHLEVLHAANMTTVAIAAAADVPTGTVYGIVNDTGRRYVEGVTAQKLLAVAAAPSYPAGHTAIIGTARRIQALTAIGYSINWQRGYLGVASGTVHKWAFRRFDHIHIDMANAVARMYNALSCTPGPSNSARAYAASHEWAPPIAWDDDIDDPNATPHHRDDADDLVDEYAVHLVLTRQKSLAILRSLAERQRAVTALAERGMDVQQIATYTASDAVTVQRILDSLDESKRRPCGICDELLPADALPATLFHPGECAAQAQRRRKAKAKRSRARRNRERELVQA